MKLRVSRGPVGFWEGRGVLRHGCRVNDSTYNHTPCGAAMSARIAGGHSSSHRACVAELVVSIKPPSFHRVPCAPFTGLVVPQKPPSFHRVPCAPYTGLVVPSKSPAGSAASAATAVWVLPEEHRTLGDDSRKNISFSAMPGSTKDMCSCVSLRKLLETSHTFSS